MNTEINYKKLLEFSADLNQGLVFYSNNVEFRLKCLMLLQTHFAYQHLAMEILETSIRTGNDYKMPNYDTVTLGLSRELISEYFSKYQKKDFLVIYGKRKDIREIYRVSDVIPYSEFERSDFYQNLYKKHGLYYQVTMNLFRDQEAIGILSILRSKPEGDFTDDEVQFFYPLRDLISNYLVNFLQIEILKTENLGLRTFSGNFPIGHIIIDDKYKIMYANPTGAEYFTHLAGMPLDQFKYYYINNVLPQINSSTDGGVADILIELPNYYLLIKREQTEPHTAWRTRLDVVSIFIQKKINASMPTSSDTLIAQELTTREIEIIEFIRQGLKNADIAKAMHLSVHTVKAHIQRIYSKVGVSNRTALLYKLNDIIR